MFLKIKVKRTISSHFLIYPTIIKCPLCVRHSSRCSRGNSTTWSLYAYRETQKLPDPLFHGRARSLGPETLPEAETWGMHSMNSSPSPVWLRICISYEPLTHTLRISWLLKIAHVFSRVLGEHVPGHMRRRKPPNQPLSLPFPKFILINKNGV